MTWAVFFARAVLGLIFFMAGVYRVFQQGPVGHVRQWFWVRLSNLSKKLSRIKTCPVIMAQCGGGEIRTHEAFRPSGFQDRRDQPLCHPSGNW
jgi:hypothetical protein